MSTDYIQEGMEGHCMADAAGDWHPWFQDLGEKSVISLTEWQNIQGDSAKDGGIRSHTARMPMSLS